MSMGNRSGASGAALILMLVLAAAHLLAGCAVTYIPVSWGIGERIRSVAARDELLKVLFARYDPKLTLLRVEGESFEEVLTPDEAKARLGAYRIDKKLVYRNMKTELDDDGLRNLLVHEVAHHVWYTAMTAAQRAEWVQHLRQNPAPWQRMVRRQYPNPAVYDGEDFAYTVEYARVEDVEMLAYLGVVTGEEALRIMRTLPATPLPPEFARRAEATSGRGEVAGAGNAGGEAK